MDGLYAISDDDQPVNHARRRRDLKIARRFNAGISPHNKGAP